MAGKQSRIANADDFSLIKGIGPVFAERIHGAGIQTYHELASMSPAQLAEKIIGLSAKQVTRQDWIGQAYKLAPKNTQSKPHLKESAKRIIRQHYENFTIEFLLDEKNRIRCTRVVHVQSGDADTWAGWEADQLVDFLFRHAGVRIPAKKFEIHENPLVHRQLLGISDSGSSLIEVKNPARLPMLSNVCETSQSGNEIAKPVLQSPTNTKFSGMLRLQNFKVLPIGSETRVCILHQGQPYHVQLTLDLTNVVVPSDIPLSYKATINFKQLGGTSCLVAEESSTIQPSDRVTLDIICASLPPGTYRPDAFVRLFSDETNLGLMASLKGELIQVF